MSYVSKGQLMEARPHPITHLYNSQEECGNGEECALEQLNSKDSKKLLNSIVLMNIHVLFISRSY